MVAAGSPGPLEKNSPSGLTARTSSRVAVAGSTCTSMPRSLIIRGVLALMPRSMAATVKRLLADGRDDVRLRRGDRLAQVGAGHLAGLAAPAASRRVGVGLGGGDADPHRAALAQVAGQGAGVDAADADDALVAQLVVEAARRCASWTARGRGRGRRSRRPRSARTRGPRRSCRCCRRAGPSSRRPGGGSWGRSASPGSRSCRWRRPPRRRSRPRRRRTHRERCDRPRGPAIAGRECRPRRTSFSASRDGSLKDVRATPTLPAARPLRHRVHGGADRFPRPPPLGATVFPGARHGAGSQP